ncbi:MAG: HupE/UreJ family protein, partial [Isosphaeraceae bacterium]
MRRALACAALMILALGWGRESCAHTRSETHSAWQVSGTDVHMQFTVPDLEARRLTEDGEMPSVETLGRYIASHVGAASGTQPCALSDGPRPVAAAALYRRYEFAFACPSGDDLRLSSSAWFDLVESHTNFAQIQDGEGRFIEQLFTSNRQTLVLADA